MKKIICCLLGIFILLTSDYYSPAAFASEISINGPETVVKPADADSEIYSSVKYTLVTDTSDAVSAYWHSDDFSMTDSGDLILEASTEAKSGIIYAEYGGETYAKYITVIKGSVNTFEQSKPGAVYGSSYKYAKALQASGNGNESVYYECGIDPSGFYYLKPATDVTSADYVTVSLDTFLTGDKKANHVPGLTACNTGWSGAVSLAIENGLYKFTAENYIADGNLLETYDYVTDIPAGKWVNVQMVVNIKDSSYDYYVDNTKIFENLHIKPMGFTDKNGTVNEVALRNIYIGGNVDNLRVYSGLGGKKDGTSSVGLKLYGNDSALIFNGKNNYVRYTLKNIFGASPVGAQYTVEPADSGVSISSDGELCITPDALESDYTVTASYDGKNASKIITLKRAEYHPDIEGPSKLARPEGIGFAYVDYKVIDEYENVYDAVFSSDTLEITSDGRLILASLSEKGTHVIKAESHGKLFEKTVEVIGGKFMDFETKIPGEKMGNAVIAQGTDINGNTTNYLHAETANDRVTVSPSGFTSMDSDISIEYDFKIPKENTTYNYMPALRTNSAHSDWNYGINLRAENGHIKVIADDYNENNSNVGKTVESVQNYELDKWAHAKLVLNKDDLSVDYYINGEKIISGAHTKYWKENNPIDMAVVIFAGDFDNYAVFSGESLNRTAVTNLPDYLSVSESENTSYPIEVNVYDDGELSESASYKIKISEYSDCFSGNAMIEDDVLNVYPKTTGSIIVSVQLDGSNISFDKTVTFFDGFAFYAGGKLTVRGNSGENITVRIYSPKSGKLTESFSESSDSYEEKHYNISSDGNLEIPVPLTEDGMYTVYVENSKGENESIIIYNGIKNLLADSEITDFVLTDAFSNILVKQTGKSKKYADGIINIYSELSGKSDVIKLIDGEINDFYVSVLLKKILESDTQSAELFNSAKSALTESGRSDSSLTAFYGNPDYEYILSSVSGESIDEVLKDIENLSVLRGIKKSINYTQAKFYLSLLSNSKYSEYTASQKNAAAKAVFGNEYKTLAELENAIINSQKNSSSTGGGSSSVGGGSSKSNNTSIGIPSTERDNIKEEFALRFSDVPRDFWGYDSIESVAEKGCINGYPDKTFRPDGKITRAEFVSIITKAFSVKGSYNISFSDVSSDDWYYDAVSSAASSGAVSGYNGMFRPDECITREDAALIIYRCLTDKTETEYSKEFNDKSDISDYAADAVNYLSSKAMVNGDTDGNFRPKDFITRVEAAKLVSNVLFAGGAE